eukprot:15328035-Ditylum_brightwellii.AAC.1
MIGVVGKHQCQIMNVQQDTSGQGRWSYLSMMGKDRKLTIISAYHVAQDKNDGIHTVDIQQYRLLKERGIEEPNPQNIGVFT